MKFYTKVYKTNKQLYIVLLNILYFFFLKKPNLNLIFIIYQVHLEIQPSQWNWQLISFRTFSPSHTNWKCRFLLGFISKTNYTQGENQKRDWGKVLKIHLISSPKPHCHFKFNIFYLVHYRHYLMYIIMYYIFCI